MPDEELTKTLKEEFDNMVRRVAVDRQNAGEPFQDIGCEVKVWKWKKGHPLNAFADVLWHFSRYGEHGADRHVGVAIGGREEMGEGRLWAT